MPKDYEPYRDPADYDAPRKHKAPKALRRLRKQFTYDLQLAKFQEIFNREPASDGELDVFVEEYLIELYNSDFDEP